MIVIPWQPALSKTELDDMSNPSFANQPEVVPWCLFDTAAIPTGQVNPVVMFQVINVDKTLSNIEGPGQLPDPQYLIVHYVACDILQIPTNTLFANEPSSSATNVENILKTGRTTFELNMSNKRYGAFSLTMCHATGGITASGYGYSTAAGSAGVYAPNNGIIGSGGFPFSGAVVIPPKIGYDITLRFGVALTLSATTNVRISLVGALYRRVL
jgi:hypothetical protein